MSIMITLPDGTQKKFNDAVTVEQVASSIGAGLAKAALAGKVNDRLVDTAYLITEDAAVKIITERDPEGLEVLRHSTAHLLAHAVKELFPTAQVTIGPVIQDGFYYDFSFPQGFTLEDLQKIEKRMAEIAEHNYPVSRKILSREEAIAFFRNQGEEYKAKIIEMIPSNEQLSLYEQGNFVDLCRGPHVPSTGRIKAFKLMKVAGAYWRGDPKNEMLQRIYGTAWPDKKSLEAYLHRLEEAEKRDHRKMAKKMDLFHQQEEAPGMAFWHAKGWTIYQAIMDYLRKQYLPWGYQEVNTPQILDRSFWEKSGHWEKFQEEMFITESEKHTFAIKPMSCPGHVQIFKQGIKSYRDLPLRLAEFGNCHRNEPSGSLHGLMRVRNFVQDDGHIFCTEDQIAGEISKFIDELKEVYEDFGFDKVTVKLSTRPPKRVGSDELWDKAEHSLEDVLNKSGLTWQLQPGDGAFYGPKIEFILQDCLDRLWTCGTMQLDFNMSARFDASYIDEDNTKKTPVMLHRAIIGSFERFIGILLEHYAGNLPLWLAPVQIAVMNITEQQASYVKEIVSTLQKHGIRAISDLRNEKISYKIRELAIERIPYIAVAGDREMSQKALSIRKQDGTDSGVIPVTELIKTMQKEIHQKGAKILTQ